MTTIQFWSGTIYIHIHDNTNYLYSNLNLSLKLLQQQRLQSTAMTQHVNAHNHNNHNHNNETKQMHGQTINPTSQDNIDTQPTTVTKIVSSPCTATFLSLFLKTNAVIEVILEEEEKNMENDNNMNLEQ